MFPFKNPGWHASPPPPVALTQGLIGELAAVGLGRGDMAHTQEGAPPLHAPGSLDSPPPPARLDSTGDRPLQHHQQQHQPLLAAAGTKPWHLRVAQPVANHPWVRVKGVRVLVLQLGAKWHCKLDATCNDEDQSST